MNSPNRRPLRLKTYDYALPGAYFITICTHKRQHLFCVESPKNVGHDPCVVPFPNAMIYKWIQKTECKFCVSINKYVIMPDHIHLLVLIEERHAGRSLPDIMRWFKTMVTNDYIRAVKAGLLPPFEQKLWQKSYYDHIVRSDEDYHAEWQYIENNPAQRLTDIENARKKKQNPYL